MSTRSAGNSGEKLFSANVGRYTTFSNIPSTAWPVRPPITLESRYTGYTGSVIAMILSSLNNSWILPTSDFAPSETNTSSIPISMPYGL